ncbi:MAG: F0F1 ATP synthase subunit A [Beutenbergiaceae bacterium]
MCRAHDPQECTLFTPLSLAPVLAEPEGEQAGPHLPTVNDFFPPMIWGDFNSWWAFDRVMLIRLIVAALLLLLLWLAVRRAKLVPGRGQSLVEMGLDFVRVQIAEQTLGKDRAKPYIGMLTVIFFSILAMNLAGIVPLLNLAGTSRMGLPMLLALWVFGAYLVAGVRAHGVGRYLKQQLVPAGVPLPILVLLTPIEFLQVFVIRPATLMLRLVANMMAGHIMLVLCFVATDFLLLYADSWAMRPIGVLTYAGAIFITVFEVFVAVLQAFIFTLLSSIYLNFALEEGH